jgi:hypothetical protein
MTPPTPLLAELVFEPYLSLFSAATAIGLVVGAALGLAASMRKDPLWLRAVLFAAAVPLTFLLAAGVEYLLRRPATWATLGQSTLGLLFGGGLWAMIRTYFRIFERSGRQLAWGLLALRLGGIALLLVILANPVWKQRSIDPGRVVVVLDNSRSMSLADAAGATRYERAKAAVEKLTKALEANQAGSRVAVELYDINGDRLDAPPAAPTVNNTDLTHALEQAGLKARAGGGHIVTGMVLISDGMDNSGAADVRDWAGAPAPVHALGFPAVESGDLDLAVRKPVAPERARIHNELQVSVPVAKTGSAGAEATVSLKLGRDVLASQKVTFGPGASEQVVPLTFTPHQAGDFVLTASVESPAGERNLANNAAQVPMHIDADPMRVFYVEGFLRYEYKYLKARLEDDPDVALVSVVRRVNPEGLAGAPDEDVLTADALKRIDVVILGDMEGKYLSPAEYQQLLRWLDEKNHSLLVLGGYKSFGPDGFRGTPLADALPVVFSDQPTPQSEESFRPQLTDRGQGHPIFTLSGDRVKDAEAWAELPPLQGMSLVQRVKPGAEELAVNPALPVDGKPAVVAAAQRAGGGGQVLVLAVDSTWRWSRLPRLVGQADTLYGRFWSQTIRWLAGRGRDDQRPPLAVSTDKPYYEVGKKAIIRVARQPRPDIDATSTQIALEITGPDGKPLPPEQTPVPRAGSAQPDVYTAEFTPSVGGRYEVNATLTADGKALANQTAEFRAQGGDYELADQGTNPAALRALAEATGGVYLDVDHAEDLAGKIARRDQMGPEHRDEFWNSPLLFAAFLACVSMEWFLRRWNQMV